MHILSYIDPGMGALIWQSIIGVFVGMLFYLRKTRQWLGHIMKKVFRIGQKHEDPAIDLQMNKGKIEIEADAP